MEHGHKILYGLSKFTNLNISSALCPLIGQDKNFQGHHICSTTYISTTTTNPHMLVT